MKPSVAQHPPIVPPKVEKWEYLIGYLSRISSGFRSDFEAIESYLNLKGSEGWELVSVHGEGLETQYIMKRKKNG